MSSERNWLFKVTVDAKDAQATVDSLVASIKILKTEMSTLRWGVPPPGGASGGAISPPSGNSPVSSPPRFSYSEASGIRAQNQAAEAMIVDQISAVRRQVDLQRELRDLRSTPIPAPRRIPAMSGREGFYNEEGQPYWPVPGSQRHIQARIEQDYNEIRSRSDEVERERSREEYRAKYAAAYSLSRPGASERFSRILPRDRFPRIVESEDTYYHPASNEVRFNYKDIGWREGEVVPHEIAHSKFDEPIYGSDKTWGQLWREEISNKNLIPRDTIVRNLHPTVFDDANEQILETYRTHSKSGERFSYQYPPEEAKSLRDKQHYRIDQEDFALSANQWISGNKYKDFNPHHRLDREYLDERMEFFERNMNPPDPSRYALTQFKQTPESDAYIREQFAKFGDWSKPQDWSRDQVYSRMDRLPAPPIQLPPASSLNDQVSAIRRQIELMRELKELRAQFGPVPLGGGSEFTGASGGGNYLQSMMIANSGTQQTVDSGPNSSTFDNFTAQALQQQRILQARQAVLNATGNLAAPSQGQLFGTGPLLGSGNIPYTPPAGQLGFGTPSYSQGLIPGFGAAYNQSRSPWGLPGNPSAGVVQGPQLASGGVQGPPNPTAFQSMQNWWAGGNKAVGDTDEKLGLLNNRFARHVGLVVETVAVYKTMEAAQRAFAQSIELTAQIELEGARAGFVIGGSRQQGQEFAQRITETGAQFGIAPSQQGDAAVRIAQTTRDQSEQLKLASDAAKLAAIGTQGYGQSVDDLVRIQRAFNIPLSETGRILDTVATIYRSVPSDISEITNLLEKLGPVAEATGLSMEQIGIIAAKTAQQAGAGMSSVVSIFTRAQENLGNTNNQQVLERYGIIPIDPSGNVRPFIQVLTEVKAKIEELKAAGRDSEALDVATAVSGKRPESLRVFLSLLDNITSKIPETSSANDAVARSMDTLDFKIKTLTSSWELLLKAFGNTEGLKRLVDALNVAVTSFTTLQNLSEKYGEKQVTEQMGASVRRGEADPAGAIATLIAMIAGKGQYGMISGQNAQLVSGFVSGYLNPDLPQAKPRRVSAGLAGLGGFTDIDMTGGPVSASVPGSNFKTDLDRQKAIASSAQLDFFNKILTPQFQTPVDLKKYSQQQFEEAKAASEKLVQIEMDMWRKRLEIAGMDAAFIKEFMEQLTNQVKASSGLYRVDGKLQQVNGAQNMFLQPELSQTPQTGFMRLGINPSQMGQFQDLMAKYHAALLAAGYKEDAVPMVLGVGKDRVQEILMQQLIYQQAASLALDELLKLEKGALNGVYNMPDGASAYVAFGGFQLDRATRTAMGSNQPVKLDTGPFGPATNKFDASVDKFSAAVQAAARAGTAPHMTRDDYIGSKADGATVSNQDRARATGSAPYKTRDDVTTDQIIAAAIAAIVAAGPPGGGGFFYDPNKRRFGDPLQPPAEGGLGGAEGSGAIKGSIDSMAGKIDMIGPSISSTLATATMSVQVVNFPQPVPVTITNNNTSILMLDGAVIANALTTFVTNNLVQAFRSSLGGGQSIP